MSEFLENLRSRFAESQKRFVAKQQQLAAVNAEFQAVAQEFNAWQTLLNLETRKEQAAATISVSPEHTQTPNVAALAISGSPSATTMPAAELNKTEIVRELLRQHSAGMTPSEIWKQVKAQIPHRPYLYSVLKRLKDKGDITDKRGKYYFKFAPKPEEAKDQNIVQ
jgi:hypothetical protein